MAALLQAWDSSPMERLPEAGELGQEGVKRSGLRFKGTVFLKLAEAF